MTYTEITDVSTNLTLREMLQYPSINTPEFYPIILFTLFFMFTLMTFFRELKREGRGNFLSSLAVGGFVTTVIATVFTFLELVQYQIVVIILVISLVFQILFMLTKKE